LKTVNLTINGIKREFTVDPEMVLIDLLREKLDLRRQAVLRPERQCGRLHRHCQRQGCPSCLQKVEKLDNAEVITGGRFGKPEIPH
jgi:aerobic-type carbon monoxide dehydrogenase small subunit (CoxS/CutS family)